MSKAPPIPAGLSASELRLRTLMAAKPACPHGLRCYRKNPAHFAEFSHPPGHPMATPPEEVTAAAPTNTAYPPAVLTPEEKERREIALIKGALTSKRGWHGKLFDDVIVGKWRAEAEGQCPLPLFEQAVLELRSNDYVNRHGIAYVDNLVPSSLGAEISGLLDNIAKREPKDFHPFSNDTVQNLIHPSLFPLVRSSLISQTAPPTSKKRGRESAVGKKMKKKKTRKQMAQDEDDEDEYEPGVTVDDFVQSMLITRPSKGIRGRQIPNARNEEQEEEWSGRDPDDPLWHCVVGDDEDSCYQWLPAEVSMKANGKLSFDSYINNLAPKDYALVSPLAKLFQLFLPKLEEVLQHPSGSPPYSLRNKKLQVIVKAANYVLKPGQTYEGGWHVEGVPAERIVGTALFYYDTSPNMQGGTLSFRRLRNLNVYGFDHESRTYKMGDNDYEGKRSLEINVDAEETGGGAGIATGFPTHKYSFEGDGNGSPYIWAVSYQHETTPNHVAVDSVPTLQGRCLFFKNSLQHKVERLYNNSATETATRKILLFWLIHPEQRIPSTLDIPVQQFDSMVVPTVRPLLLDLLRTSTLADIVLEFIREGMTDEEAKLHRLGLMKERKFVSKKVNAEYEMLVEREYSFCEH